MQIDIGITAPLAEVPGRAQALSNTGIDGLFTFEGPTDVFFPLVAAAPSAPDVDLYTNVAIAFPRSPMHLAVQAWDLQRLTNGRFSLGLGTQIKPHIERRYSATWGKPVAHMAELIAAVRAIFDCWHTGAKLDHHGEYYNLDLMTPMFVPGEVASPPPIWVGALGPVMTSTMAKVADGIMIHPFNTSSFLEATTVARIDEALAEADRPRSDLTLGIGCIAAPVLTDEQYEAVTTAIRFNLAFYGSTPAYRVTLDHHGLGELQPKLRELTKQGKWDQLASVVNDEVVDLIAVRGDPAHVANELNQRYGRFADRVAITLPPAVPNEALAEMVSLVD